ncbi:beta-galactosidase [Novosphingobium profundi]|uniref:glycoside hydrolase family 35 protein n=1 Tax=Novosphingobium profundi TaxID=1774954 RepID=UPI001BDAB022|nr:beta-galactosidase family protein [Novosphingobium profundi]MBT0668481.1 beta-galactosidase [Novosphingobium profundi]
MSTTSPGRRPPFRRWIHSGIALGFAGALLAPSTALAGEAVASAAVTGEVPRSDPMGGPAAVAGRQVISGSMFYPRIPRAYWRDRLKKARAMGLNTIETYAFWNVHERAPGTFDFTGQNDIAEFIREAAEEGLMVIVRPGPYVCAEWDWGGLPPWLNKDPQMVVRSQYPGFMAAAQRYLNALAKEVAPLQKTNGGPVIGIQVENEYGSYGEDHAYMEAMRAAFVRAGFSPRLLFTADGPDLLQRGALPDLPVALNFAPGSAKGAFAALEKFRPGAPIFVGEYWDGWFDHWGAKRETRDGTAMAAELKQMLEAGASVNLYMFTGGTSFGWMAGANAAGANADHTTGAKVNYEPDVTSYDYDSPLSEDGRVTPKFFAFRDAIQSVTGEALPPVPQDPGTITLAPIALGKGQSLWSRLPAPVATGSEVPPTMEDVGQSYGYILYRTKLGEGAEHPVDLVLPEVRAYAAIYLDGVFQGAIDRRLKQTTLTLASVKRGATLSILVENTGRVNYGPALPGERAGLVGAPKLDGRTLSGWSTYSLPMNPPPKVTAKGACEGPCFYKASFEVERAGDTFLDTAGLSKGVVFVNGHNLGRYWNVGPQRTLYLPGAFLKPGRNEILVFDLYGRPGLRVEGLAKAELGAEPKVDPHSAQAR